MVKGNPAGLVTMCEKVLGLSLWKNEQLSDWAQRPLTRPQVIFLKMFIFIVVLGHLRFKRRLFSFAYD